MRTRIAGILAGIAVAVAAAELKVGSERAAQSRSGVAVRESPKPLAKVLKTLPYGSRAVVQEVSGHYARVKCPDGVTGWVRVQDLVEPGALAAAGGTGADVKTADVSAAGRQFDESTEKRYRATAKELEAAYAVVDALEKRAPSASETEAFAKEGRLVR